MKVDNIWLGSSLGTTLRTIVPLVRSACPMNPWLARFACSVIYYVAVIALRKAVPKLDPSPIFHVEACVEFCFLKK